jgi:hypothetical protein
VGSQKTIPALIAVRQGGFSKVRAQIDGSQLQVMILWAARDCGYFIGRGDAAA